MRLAFTLYAAISVAGIAVAQKAVFPDLFQFHAPKGFLNKGTTNAGTRTVYEAKASGGYAANMTVLTVPAGFQTARSLGKDAIAGYKSDPSVKVLSHGDKRISGKAGYSIRLARRIKKIDVVQQQMVVIHKGKAVAFTFSTSKQLWPQHSQALETALKSIVWL